MNEQAKNALAKWREENKGVKAKVLDPIEKAKQNPKSKVLAIRAYCFDCCGGVKSEVTLCLQIIARYGFIALGRVKLKKMMKNNTLKSIPLYELLCFYKSFNCIYYPDECRAV